MQRIHALESAMTKFRGRGTDRERSLLSSRDVRGAAIAALVLVALPACSSGAAGGAVDELNGGAVSGGAAAIVDASPNDAHPGASGSSSGGADDAGGASAGGVPNTSGSGGVNGGRVSNGGGTASGGSTEGGTATRGDAATGGSTAMGGSAATGGDTATEGGTTTNGDAATGGSTASGGSDAGSDAAPAGGGCAPSEVFCSGICTDTSSDVQNCGACDAPCTVTGQICQGGVCACAAGLTLCDGACADLETDAKNCGACGNACSENHCTAGCCGYGCTAECSGNGTVTCVRDASGCMQSKYAVCANGYTCIPSAGAVCLDPDQAAWPMPNCPADVLAGAPHPERYDTAGVKDLVTGLTWLAGAVGDELNLEQSQSISAFDYCNNAGWASGQWRVPSVIELETLANPDGAASAILSQIPAGSYRTTSHNGGGQIWYVQLPSGLLEYSSAGASYYGTVTGVEYVLCVEGTQPFGGTPDPYYKDTVASGTVHDARTGLTWQQTPPTGTYTQAAASQYCATLSLKGTGWRLPTIKELATIADFTTIGATSADPYAGTPFSGMQVVPHPGGGELARFWSSTAMAGDPSHAWAFDYLSLCYCSYGPVSNESLNATPPVSDSYLVRCVR
jgi:hypothetical protein